MTVNLENHKCVFVGGILQCAHHSIDQMFTHETDILATMIGDATEPDQVKEPSLRRYLDICMKVVREKAETIATFSPSLKDMYEKDPCEILMELFDKKEWSDVEKNFIVNFQFENVKSTTSAPTDRLPLKESIITVPLNTPVPLPSIQQYFLKSVNHLDPAGYVKRIDTVSDYLLISLMVYDYKDGVPVKNYPTHLNIHTLFNMSLNTISQGKIAYRLRGMIVHQGSKVGSGHYYYVLFDDKLRQWAFDDQVGKVVQKNMESFSTKECPYMLLYKKV